MSENLPAEREDASAVLKRHEGNTLPGLMAGHHPIHGLFGAAFEEVGGFRRLTEWADENYSDFVKIFSRMAPKPEMLVDRDRKHEIEINPVLKQTELD